MLITTLMQTRVMTSRMDLMDGVVPRKPVPSFSGLRSVGVHTIHASHFDHAHTMAPLFLFSSRI